MVFRWNPVPLGNRIYLVAEKARLGNLASSEGRLPRKIRVRNPSYKLPECIHIFYNSP